MESSLEMLIYSDSFVRAADWSSLRGSLSFSRGCTSEPV